MSDEHNNLIWLDLEMTGLNIDRDVIIEIATVVTDGDLNIIAKGPNLAISQPQDLLDGMDKWNTEHHTASGLVARVQKSDTLTSQAEAQTLTFLSQHVKKGDSPLCGNSVHTDRRFLEKYMPRLADYFHYRHLDVSTIKELAKRWAPALYENYKKDSAHLALDDIIESIDELKYYQEHFFYTQNACVR